MNPLFTLFAYEIINVPQTKLLIVEVFPSTLDNVEQFKKCFRMQCFIHKHTYLLIHSTLCNRMLKRNDQMSRLQNIWTIMGADKQKLLLLCQIVQNNRALSSTKPHQPHLGPPPTPGDIGALFKLITGPSSFSLS